MAGNPKKEKSKLAGNRAAAKRKGKTGKGASEDDSNKKFQMNAAAFVGHMLSIFIGEGLEKAIFTILKTVRPWPSLIDKADPDAFVPPFNASKISAEEFSVDDAIITKVSFSYLDKTFTLVARINRIPTGIFQAGSITLDVNDERVVDMGITLVKDLDHYNFQELNVFKSGAWTEDIVRIEQEIEPHEAE